MVTQGIFWSFSRCFFSLVLNGVQTLAQASEHTPLPPQCPIRGVFYGTFGWRPPQLGTRWQTGLEGKLQTFVEIRSSQTKAQTFSALKCIKASGITQKWNNTLVGNWFFCHYQQNAAMTVNRWEGVFSSLPWPFRHCWCWLVSTVMFWRSRRRDLLEYEFERGQTCPWSSCPPPPHSWSAPPRPPTLMVQKAWFHSVNTL